MKFNKSLLAVAITSITALALYGCGTEKQDGGNGSSNADISSGVAVDGPIARALVYYDLNNNRKKDPSEPAALTDNNGHYNDYKDYNGDVIVKYIDYCKGLEARPEFCLKLTEDQKKVFTDDTKLIVTGGYDLYTGEPFEGTLSMPANKTYQAGGRMAITPMSSMIYNGSQGVRDLLAYAKTLPGITGTTWAGTLTKDALVTLNFLESEAKFNAPAFAITYRLHKYVSVIENWVKEQPAYSEIKDGEKLNSDISGLIYLEYENLNNADFSSAWTAIDTKIQALYNEANLTAPSAPDTAALIQYLADIKTASEKSFGIAPHLGSELTFANVKGRTRGIELVVLKVIRGAPYESAITALDDSGYLTSLEGADSTTDSDGKVTEKGSFNFTQLVEATGTPAEIIAAANSAKNTTGSSLSSDLAGKMLDFEDDGSDENKKAKAAIFFTGAEGATRGDIHLCLKYLEKEDSAGDFSDNNLSNESLKGDYIPGTWETLAALNNTVMLRLDYLGGRSAVLKKIGLTGNGVETEYRFDFNGETSKFTSDQGFEDTPADTQIITSSEACKTYVDATSEV